VAARWTKKAWAPAFWTAKARSTKIELARLAEFASDKRSAKGQSEPGLSLAELGAYMDANFARAAGCYLSLKEVEELFTKRQLPARMNR
jgi:hypothetical protein